MRRGFPGHVNRLSDMESRDRGSGRSWDLDIVFGGVQGGDIRAGTGKDHSFPGLLE